MDLTQFHENVQWVSGHLWDWLVVLLIGTGLFYSVATGFVQVRLFGRSI